MADVLCKFLFDLAALTTDEEKFSYTWSMFNNNRLPPVAKPKVKSAESDDCSETMRSIGNDHYKNKQYELAVGSYSISLIKAAPGSVNYALALANRSAAFFRMAKYKYCLTDIKRAIDTKVYPAELMHKLYTRAETAIGLLNRGNLAEKNDNKCPSPMDEVTMPLNKKIDLIVDTLHRVTVSDDLEVGQKEKQLQHSLLGGRNEQIPAFSKFLELGCSNMRRGVYASRDISPGDIVVVEKPYLCRPSNDISYICCYSRCLKLNLAIIPCTKCHLTVYCNEECMKKSSVEDGHDLECKILFAIGSVQGNIETNKLTLQCFLKAVSQMGLDKYCSLVKDFSNSKVDILTRGFNKNGQYMSDDFFTVYSLYNKKHLFSIKVTLVLNTIATEILQLVINNGIKIPKHQIGTVGASLVQLINIFHSNTIKIRTPSLNAKVGSIVLAHGLYPSTSLFNHSCDPNIMISGLLIGTDRTIRAVQPIRKGSELCLSYCTNVKHIGKELRKEKFANEYLFECDCQPCEENWPTIEYSPNRLSSLNLLNPSMAEIVSKECEKFLKFQNSVDSYDTKHLNYLYFFAELLLKNVKRPFKLYEECIEIIINTHFSIDWKSQGSEFFNYI